ncbi:MAG: hypothetical protein JO030_00910, partial [Candidatus Eremiobacteraeota bacterium]|nr:hypothetical protein [Candidatus Eremiobacteraeota bacterium]
MKAPLARRFSFAAIALLFVCGCGAPRSTPVASNPPSGILPIPLSARTAGQAAATRMVRQDGAGIPDRKRTRPLLYVTNFDPAYPEVTVYRADALDPHPIRAISKGLFESVGDCVSPDGTLYVTNIPGNSLGWISVYPPDQSRPSRMITNGVDIPDLCALDRQGNLWVTNYGGANVAEYKAGASQPSEIITRGVPYPAGIAFDRSGNMYVSNDSGGSQPTCDVVVYRPGKKKPARTITDGQESAAGIAVDS